MNKLILIIFSIILLINCNRHENHQSLIKKIKELSVAPNNSKIDILQHDTNELIKVTESDFFIKKHKQKLELYNCTECHTKPLSKFQSTSLLKKKAHWDIKISHYDKMKCNTCHNTNGDITQLQNLNGGKIDLDQTYKLCSQCHNTQYKDWLNGSHGKSHEYWTNPKVKYNCAECHNPHKPSFEKKFPARIISQ